MKFLFHSNHNDRERENNQCWGLVYILIGEIPYLEYDGPIPRRQGCTLHCFTPLRKHRKSTKQKAENINTSCEERKMVICDPISDWWSFCYQSPMLYSTMKKKLKWKKNKTKKTAFQDCSTLKVWFPYPLSWFRVHLWSVENCLSHLFRGPI